MSEKKVQYLIVDTSAFIKNAPLHEIGQNIVTIQEVVDEILNKRQIRRLVVLPYDLVIKDIFAENIKFVTEFAKKTGDYLSLSLTDIKVIALTYQLEKEHVGNSHLKNEPTVARTINLSKPAKDEETTEELAESFSTLNCTEEIKCVDGKEVQDVLPSVKEGEENEDNDVSDDGEYSEDEESDDEAGWITVENVSQMKKSMGSNLLEEKPSVVACMTTDFAMQNVLKQIGLNVAALDGRVIKQLRTFILRCYTCFKTTSIMTKLFCPNCGNKTLKRVAVSLDENGKQQIHINIRKPLTNRGKKFSLPTPQGGKHANNPILYADQPIPQQRLSKLARQQNDPMNPEYIAGYSPFVTRDVCSRSALLGIHNQGAEVKHWMKKNPNEARRRRK